MSDDEDNTRLEVEVYRDGEPQRIANVLPVPTGVPEWIITENMRNRVCATCRAVAVLHQDPDEPRDPRRTLCGRCSGEANRRIVDTWNPGARTQEGIAKKKGW